MLEGEQTGGLSSESGEAENNLRASLEGQQRTAPRNDIVLVTERRFVSLCTQ